MYVLYRTFILIFSIILILTRMITRLIHYLFLSKSTNWVNRLLGTFFGMTKGILFVMIFFWIFELIPNSRIKEIVNQKSMIADHLVEVRKTIVLTFNFSDPVEKGEKTILDYLKLAISNSSPGIYHIKQVKHLNIAYKEINGMEISLSELEIMAEKLKRTQENISIILDNNDSDRVLSGIFSNFCIGK